MTKSADYSEEFSFHQELLIPVKAWCDPHEIHAKLASGVTLSIPVEWFPFVQDLSLKDRNDITCSAFGIWWTVPDEGISIEGMIKGVRQRQSRVTIMDAAE